MRDVRSVTIFSSCIKYINENNNNDKVNNNNINNAQP